MKILKSIGAILAGFITVFALSVITDMIFESTGIFPGAANPELYVPWMLALALAYRTVITILGGFVTAKLAPSKPLKHAVILGIIGTIAGTIGVVVAWDFGNHWYPIALAILALPSTWLGGKLKK